MVFSLLAIVPLTANAASVEVSSASTPAPKKPQVSIPSLPGQTPRTNRFVDGKVLVERVELKGNSLFPQYGVTQAYLSQAINEAYQKLDPWMSISDMHSIADAVTIAYHAKGLTFNQVFVVPNEIRNNTLSLNILPGRISEINLKNNKLFSERQIKKPFLELLGKVVYEPDVQKAMKKANLIPGLKVFGFFSMGKYPGQTRLNIHVVSESKHTFSVRADNYGVEDTGAFRLLGFYSQNNLSGQGDTLDAKLVTTNEIGNLLGSVAYYMPFSENSTIGASLMTNQYEVVGDFEAIGLTGILSAFSGHHNKSLLKQDNAIADFSQTLSYKNSKTTSSEFEDLFTDNTSYLTYRPSFRAVVITPDGTQRQALSAAVTLGEVLNSDDDDLNKSIMALHFNYNHEYRWIPSNQAAWVSKADFAVNYAPDVLPPAERMVLTGAYSVRSYKPALFSGDSVYSVKFDQTFAAFRPLNGLKLLPYYFADYSHGEQNKPNGGNASFLGTGLGLMIYYRSNLSANFSLGVPISESFNQDISEEIDDYIVFGYINFTF